MSFGQPLLLLMLLVVPAILGAYAWQLSLRRRRAVRHSDVPLLRLAVGKTATWRRHIPMALVVAGLGLLGLAAGRPQVRADVPLSGSTIILALDVSGSMCATDVDPNRLSAAQAAVRTFVESQSDETRLGLVLFSGFAQLAVPPTTERQDLLDTLDAVTTGRGTTIGAAILTSLDAIAEIDPNVQPSDRVDAPGSDATDAPGAGTPAPTPPAGSAGSAGSVPEIIVLLTDGANTRGVTPEDAAQQAAARGVRIYPIGFGTRNPTSLVCTREQYGGIEPRFGPGVGGPAGGVGRGNRYLLVDEDALRTVAKTSGGQYFAATDAAELNGVLTDLPRHVTNQTRDVDVSAAFTVAAALCLIGGLAWSLRRSVLS